MKILILGFGKIKYLPFASFYLDLLRKNGNEIHFIYWKRDSNPDIALPDDVITYSLDYYQEDEVPKVTKIYGFILYRRFVKRVLNKAKFDLIVVLTSIPGVLLNDILTNQYHNRFIFDYRDHTYEAIGFYKNIIAKLVNASLATFISSDAYRKYLPSTDKIHTTHNILMDSLKFRDVRRRADREKDCIRIRFWGYIRHETINKALINRLANDKRFELHYHGREQETANNLKRYCIENNILNVFFHGEYSPTDRYEFAAETDILHNLYDTQASDAMGNKYYDGLVFYIPQICNFDSYMGAKILENGLGVACKLECENFTDELYKFYNSIIWDEFIARCDDELNDILAEYQAALNMIKDLDMGNI